MSNALAAESDGGTLIRCFDTSQVSPELMNALRDLNFGMVDGKPRKITSIKFNEPQKAINEDQLWELVGKQPSGPIQVDQAAVIHSRLVATGLFAKVSPRIEVATVGTDVILYFDLQIYPIVREVRIPTGERVTLDQDSTLEVLKALFGKPSSVTSPSTDPQGCPAPAPPTAWLAGLSGKDTISRGVVLQGLEKALQRVLERLHRGGYLLTQLEATLQDEVLTLYIDPDQNTSLVLRVGSETDAAKLFQGDFVLQEPFQLEAVDKLAQHITQRFPYLTPEEGTRPEPLRFFLQSSAIPSDGGASSDGGISDRGTLAALSPDGGDSTDGGMPSPDRNEDGGVPVKGVNTPAGTYYVIYSEIPHETNVPITLGIPASSGVLPLQTETDGGVTSYTVPTKAPPKIIPRQIPAYLSIADDGKQTPDGGVDLPSRKTVTLRFEEHPAEFNVDWAELLRHTPVTGYAPGLKLRGELFDLSRIGVPDKAPYSVHLATDAILHVNTAAFRKRAPPVLPAADGLLSLKVQIPAAEQCVPPVPLERYSLKKAGNDSDTQSCREHFRFPELGLSVYSLVDTFDDWRVSSLDSYLHSLILDQPYRDYFERRGLGGYANVTIDDRLLAGVELRRDEYYSLPDLKPYLGSSGVLLSDSTRPANDPVNSGIWTSVIVRLEWSASPSNYYEVGTPTRHAETSLVRRSDEAQELNPLRITATLEGAGWGVPLSTQPRILGTFNRSFWRWVVDVEGHLSTLPRQRLVLRMRYSGGTRRPSQKLEALGGWSALRGYGFKEFRHGDDALLATAEYQFRRLSFFADLGSIRLPSSSTFNGSWQGPYPSAGLSLFIGPSVEISAAWRFSRSSQFQLTSRPLYQPEFEVMLHDLF